MKEHHDNCLHVALQIIATFEKIESVLYQWDESPEDIEKVKLRLEFDDYVIESLSKDGYFRALIKIRRILEAMGMNILCYGACKYVYPSPMIESSGSAEKAYILHIGEPAVTSNLVSIFDYKDGIPIATVLEQELFYNKWQNSIKQ